MFEKNPSGGYLTNGNDNEGAITRVVPGGNANLPSDVTHSILFCLECPFWMDIATLKMLINSNIIGKLLNAFVRYS